MSYRSLPVFDSINDLLVFIVNALHRFTALFIDGVFFVNFGRRAIVPVVEFLLESLYRALDEFLKFR